MIGTEALLFAAGIYAILKILGVVMLLVFIADTINRRISLIWTDIGHAVMIFISIYTRVEPPTPGKPILPLATWQSFVSTLGAESTSLIGHGLSCLRFLLRICVH